jgi:cystathionine gamma-synthase
MSAKITTQFGHAVPPAPRHSVTVHMPTWQNVERYGADSASVIATFKNAYPRMKPHKDIADVSSAGCDPVNFPRPALLTLFAACRSRAEASRSGK